MGEGKRGKGRDKGKYVVEHRSDLFLIEFRESWSMMLVVDLP